MTASPQLITLAQQLAQRYRLDAEVVCAIVEQESGWNTYAIRYEEGFRVKYVAPKHLEPTEEVARSISWGLMQVMGEDAREFGFTGDLPALCVALNGLEYGCKIFAHKLAVNDGDVSKALEAWNGGENKQYAAEVLARVGRYA